MAALQIPGKQIVVYGHSGSGKTTLLVNKLHQIYEKHYTTRCTKTTTWSEILLSGIDEVDKYYVSEKRQSKRQELEAKIGADLQAIKFQLQGKQTKEAGASESRVLPPQVSAQNLAKFIGATKACWVIEDFHKVDDSEKLKLSQVMKLFMDMSDEFKELKIIAIGAVNSAREIVNYDSEMKNRVAEIHVPLLNEAELGYIIEKGCELLNIIINSHHKQAIIRYSNGLASVCHQLCYNICFAADIHETAPTALVITDKIVEKAVTLYLENASDSLKAAFDKVINARRIKKYNNEKIILEALSECPPDGVIKTLLLKKIREKTLNYSISNLTLYLKRLQEEANGALIWYDPNSGKFAFSDPIYLAFAKTFFDAHRENPSTSKKDIVIVEDVIKDLIIKLGKSFFIEGYSAMIAQAPPTPLFSTDQDQ